jgi:hypothetical protein
MQGQECEVVVRGVFGNLWSLALPKKIDNWALASLQQRLVKKGGRLPRHARTAG